MKVNTRLLKAAKRQFNRPSTRGYFSCLEIDDTYGKLYLYSCSKLGEWYGNMFAGETANDQSSVLTADHVCRAAAEIRKTRREFRTMLLCMAAAVAKTEYPHVESPN